MRRANSKGSLAMGFRYSRIWPIHQLTKKPFEQTEAYYYFTLLLFHANNRKSIQHYRTIIDRHLVQKSLLLSPHPDHICFESLQHNTAGQRTIIREIPWRRFLGAWYILIRPLLNQSPPMTMPGAPFQTAALVCSFGKGVNRR